MTASTPHPLQRLSEDEFRKARDIILKLHGSDDSLFFRSIYLSEPKKADLIPFLEAEHSGSLTASTPRPPRQALVEYDVHRATEHEYIRSVVDIHTGELVTKESAPRNSHPYITVYVWHVPAVS